MVGVTTVALIERKPGISRDLFTRYWRDVHGVMAARIPGFETYTQYHVSPLGDREPFEGIAIVTYASEADRQGLSTSAVTPHIHRDEQNVFRRALLYNLDATARRTGGDGDRTLTPALFFAVPEGGDPELVRNQIAATNPAFCDSYDLTTGDPAGWNDTDTDDSGRGRRFIAVLHAGWLVEPDGPQRADIGVPAYRLDEAHVMVKGGLPTPVGLRGLDAVRTIMEAGADNQLANDVVHAIYGLSGGARSRLAPA